MMDDFFKFPSTVRVVRDVFPPSETDVPGSEDVEIIRNVCRVF